MSSLTDFLTNKNHGPDKGGITHPATSLAKGGIGGAFVTATISAIVGLVHSVSGQNTAVVNGAFHLAGLAIIAAAIIAVADLLARAYISGIEAQQEDS